MDTSITFIRHRVGSLPNLYYVPDYVNPDAENRLLESINSSRSKWTQLSGRRLQNHGGVVHDKGLIATSIPDWLQGIMMQLHQDTGVYGDKPPNHVLVNYYAPGEGIMAHEDGPLYHPGVCIVSLGGPCVIRFRRKLPDGISPDVELSVVLMPRSLLIFTDEAYTDCLHGIDQVEEEVLDSTCVNLEQCGLQLGDKLPRGSARVSLTVRRVLKVFKNLLKR